MTRAAYDIDKRADLERVAEQRRYIKGIQLGNEAIFKALLSYLLNSTHFNNSMEREAPIEEIRSAAMSSFANIEMDNGAKTVEVSVATWVIQTVLD